LFVDGVENIFFEISLKEQKKEKKRKVGKGNSCDLNEVIQI